MSDLKDVITAGNNKDYYGVLGIDQSASPGEIKKAYKKMTLETHPDKHDEGDKDDARAAFKNVQEAFNVLGDPSKKEKYDQTQDIKKESNENQSFNQQAPKSSASEPQAKTESPETPEQKSSSQSEPQPSPGNIIQMMKGPEADAHGAANADARTESKADTDADAASQKAFTSASSPDIAKPMPSPESDDKKEKKESFNDRFNKMANTQSDNKKEEKEEKDPHQQMMDELLEMVKAKSWDGALNKINDFMNASSKDDPSKPDSNLKNPVTDAAINKDPATDIANKTKDSDSNNQTKALEPEMPTPDKITSNPLQNAHPPSDMKSNDNPISKMQNDGGGFDKLAQSVNGKGVDTQQITQIVAENPEILAAL